MEKIRKKKISMINDIIDKKEEEFVANNEVKIPIVLGWTNTDDLAKDIWGSIHSILLKGYPVFAYRDMEKFQIVIVRNSETDYAMGMITPGYSMLLPHIPLDYLSEKVIEDLENFKVNKSIIESYKQIIEDLKK